MLKAALEANPAEALRGIQQGVVLSHFCNEARAEDVTANLNDIAAAVQASGQNGELAQAVLTEIADSIRTIQRFQTLTTAQKLAAPVNNNAPSTVAPAQYSLNA